MDWNNILSLVSNPYLLMGLVICVVVLWYGWGVYQDTQPDRLRLRIRTKTQQWRQISRIKILNNRVSVNDTIYNVVPTCIERIGLLRIPTLYVYEGNKSPINFNYAQMTKIDAITGEPILTKGGGIETTTLRVEDSTSGKDFKQALETHVASDAINSFKSELLSTASMIMIVILVGGLGMMIYFNKQSSNSIITQLTTNSATLEAIGIRSGAITPTPTPLKKAQ